LAVYLVQSRQGKLRQLYIPKHLEERVRQAVADYQQLQRLLEELSEEEWKLLQERKE
jgi:FtsZ-binding cell division protein ZapB